MNSSDDNLLVDLRLLCFGAIPRIKDRLQYTVTSYKWPYHPYHDGCGGVGCGGLLGGWGAGGTTRLVYVAFETKIYEYRKTVRGDESV